MRKSFFPGTTGIFALFFVPYIVTIIFNGANTTLINKKFNVEMLLPVIVSSQIEDKYELETIKAQTIIARSNFYRTMKEEKNLAITLCQIKEEMEGKSLACVILQNKYEKAVTETEGKVIVWNKELKLVPYHELSAGQTRDGMEVFHNEDDSYLRSVHSLVDKNEILIQRYSREMSHIKEQLEAKEKCLMEYQHAAQWKAHRDVESLIKEKERLAKCLLEQLDTFKKLKILSKSETILPDSDWRNLIEIVNTLYDDFISRLRVAYPDLTEDAIRFCCLIKLRLTSAELMSVLNVTKDAIYKRKFRLKKELMPDDDTRSLDDFLGSY